MNCGLDRNHENIMVFFTAFVWGSTYTTHKNAKIYRYSWLFAYYRRELWERSRISILKKNRSFQTTLLILTTVSWNQNKGQCPCLPVPSEALLLLWFQPNNQNYTSTRAVLGWSLWMHTNTQARAGCTCSLSKLQQRGAGEPRASPTLLSTDLEYLYTTGTFHSHHIGSLGSIHRKGKIIFLLNKVRNVNSVTSLKKTKPKNSLRTCNW